MALAQTLWDDDVERLAESILLCKSKDSFRTGIPEPDDTISVGVDDGVRDVRDECSTELRKLGGA